MTTKSSDPLPRVAIDDISTNTESTSLVTTTMPNQLPLDIQQTLKDAGAVRVPPWLAVVSALCSAQPAGMRETFEWLAANCDEIARSYRVGETEPLSAAVVAPDLQFVPDVGSLDRSINDHWLRERRIFADLVGQRSFMQVAVYAIAGVELSSSDAAMLEQFALACLTVDRRAWPMAVTRRVAGHGGGIAAAVVAGAAMMASPMLAGVAAADCARFLRSAAEAESSGVAVTDTIAALLARKERVMGFGRPVVGPDERSPVLEQIIARYGRGDGRYVSLLRRAEAAFFEQRGLKTTAAAWSAAILSDLGLTPPAVHALSNHWVTVCVFAQAAFSDERARAEQVER